MPSIVEMPDLVLKRIIKFSDFKAVLTLRQVCRDFRNFIDDLKDSKLPDSEFTQLSLLANNRLETDDSISIYYYDKNDRQGHFYCGKSNSRFANGKTIDLGSSNILDVAIRDLELVLRFQKSALERLNFTFQNFQPQNKSSIQTILIKLSTMFGKLNRRFKTSVLETKPSDKSQVIPVLQLADPETLRSIDLSSSREVLEMEYDGFGETEQWKNAKGLNCHFYLMNLNVKDVCHFSWIDIKVNSLDASDFDTLKKAYTSSSEFKMWQFRLKHFNQREQLSNIWGPPFVLGQDIHWYFRMKNPEEVKILHIDIQDPVSMNVEFYWTDFHLIEMAHVPDGETVHDYIEN